MLKKVFSFEFLVFSLSSLPTVHWFYNLFLYISIYFWIFGLLFTAYCLPCFFTLYFILCTLYFVLYTLYFILYTLYFILCTLYLCSLFKKVQKVYCSLRNTNCTNLRIYNVFLFVSTNFNLFLFFISIYCSLFPKYNCLFPKNCSLFTKTLSLFSKTLWLFYKTLSLFYKTLWLFLKMLSLFAKRLTLLLARSPQWFVGTRTIWSRGFWLLKTWNFF